LELFSLNLRFYFPKVSDPELAPLRPAQKISAMERDSECYLDRRSRSEGDGCKWTKRSLREVPAGASEVQEQGDFSCDLKCMLAVFEVFCSCLWFFWLAWLFI